MFLSDIIIYPIKSLPGIHLNKARVEPRGLQHDRRWMLIDETNTFVSLRQHYNMLWFDLHQEEDGFVVKHRKSGDTLEVPWSMAGGKEVKASIWEDVVSVKEGKASWSSWLSEKIGFSCRLVYMDDTVNRPVNPKWAKNNEVLSFADAYPLLVVGAASLADLNGKLERKITINRFRPNLVFEGGDPYEEFRWGKFEVGKTLFQGLKPCERCVVTTLDPLTAERGREPLHTLSRQKVEGNIAFGQYACVANSGVVKTNDNVKVVNYKDSPYDQV